MRANYFKVGLVSLLAIGVLLGGYFYLTRFRFAQKRYHYRVSFHDVARINEGDLVTVMGVPKGRIGKIEVYQDSVVAWITLDDFPLREGAEAWVETQGLVGQFRLTLSPGKGRELPDNALIRGHSPRGLAEVLSSMGEVMQGLDTTFMKINRLIDSVQVALGGALLTFERSSAQIERLTANIARLIEQNQGNLDSTLRSLQALSLRTDSLLALLQHGEGSVQKLLREDSLYQELRTTLRSLDSLLVDLRAHPKRYVKFSLF